MSIRKQHNYQTKLQTKKDTVCVVSSYGHSRGCQVVAKSKPSNFTLSHQIKVSQLSQCWSNKKQWFTDSCLRAVVRRTLVCGQLFARPFFAGNVVRGVSCSPDSYAHGQLLAA